MIANSKKGNKYYIMWSQITIVWEDTNELYKTRNVCTYISYIRIDDVLHTQLTFSHLPFRFITFAAVLDDKLSICPVVHSTATMLHDADLNLPPIRLRKQVTRLCFKPIRSRLKSTTYFDFSKPQGWNLPSERSPISSPRMFSEYLCYCVSARREQHRPLPQEVRKHLSHSPSHRLTDI